MLWLIIPIFLYDYFVLLSYYLDIYRFFDRLNLTIKEASWFILLVRYFILQYISFNFAFWIAILSIQNFTLELDATFYEILWIIISIIEIQMKDVLIKHFSYYLDEHKNCGFYFTE